MAETLTTKIRTLTKLLFHEPETLSALVSQRLTGYLFDTGWFASYQTKTPVDAQFQAIPWFTYPAIDFLGERLKKSFAILEYGAGNSSVYFSERVGSVDALEHNAEWFAMVNTKVSGNTKLHLISEEDLSSYASFPATLNKKYDLIIVDAIDRNACMQQAVSLLREGGIIVLDDSEREEYADGRAFVVAQGFKCLDFWGMAPIVLHKKCTSFFYKQDNCLAI